MKIFKILKIFNFLLSIKLLIPCLSFKSLADNNTFSTATDASERDLLNPGIGSIYKKKEYITFKNYVFKRCINFFNYNSRHDQSQILEDIEKLNNVIDEFSEKKNIPLPQNEKEELYRLIEFEVKTIYNGTNNLQKEDVDECTYRKNLYYIFLSKNVHSLLLKTKKYILEHNSLKDIDMGFKGKMWEKWIEESHKLVDIIYLNEDYYFKSLFLNESLIRNCNATYSDRKDKWLQDVPTLFEKNFEKFISEHISIYQNLLF